MHLNYYTMIKLAKREEQIMEIFWDLQKTFIRNITPQLKVGLREIVVQIYAAGLSGINSFLMIAV